MSKFHLDLTTLSIYFEILHIFIVDIIQINTRGYSLREFRQRPGVNKLHRVLVKPLIFRKFLELVLSLFGALDSLKFRMESDALARIVEILDEKLVIETLISLVDHDFAHISLDF